MKLKITFILNRKRDSNSPVPLDGQFSGKLIAASPFSNSLNVYKKGIQREGKLKEGTNGSGAD